jgi:ribosomal protein S4
MVTFLPGLEPETQRAEKVWKRVRPTSVAAYEHGRRKFRGRSADALRSIAAYRNKRQEWPTARETAHQLNRDRWAKMSIAERDMATLRMRRAIADLQTKGVVEANGPRFCCVGDNVVETWRVVEAGRG